MLKKKIILELNVRLLYKGFLTRSLCPFIGFNHKFSKTNDFQHLAGYLSRVFNGIRANNELDVLIELMDCSNSSFRSVAARIPLSYDVLVGQEVRRI